MKNYDIEVFRSDSDPCQLYVHVYTKGGFHPSELKNLSTIREKVKTNEDRLVRTLGRIGLDKGRILKSEWGMIRSDDGVNILVIRLTADKEFITNKKDIALALNSVVWHPAHHRWLVESCRKAIEPPEGTVLTRTYYWSNSHVQNLKLS